MAKASWHNDGMFANNLHRRKSEIEHAAKAFGARRIGFSAR
jgi:hypothetical protein